MSNIHHNPLRPARNDMPREVALLRLWQDFATQHPLLWKRIFRTNGPDDQRAASIAASFMVYMGCNLGMAFTERAERLWCSGVFGSREEAFRAAWALHNARHRSVNHNMRAIEFMLATDFFIKDNGDINWSLVPDLTLNDIDAVESMVCWWAGDTAAIMREAAETQAHAAYARMAFQDSLADQAQGELA